MLESILSLLLWLAGLFVKKKEEGSNVALNEALNCGHNLSGQNDDRGGSVTDLLILSTSKLDHALGCWVSNIDL